jgi:hypothetical protein
LGVSSCPGPVAPTKKCELGGGAEFRNDDLSHRMHLFQPAELCYHVVMIHLHILDTIYLARF